MSGSGPPAAEIPGRRGMGVPHRPPSIRQMDYFELKTVRMQQG